MALLVDRYLPGQSNHKFIYPWKCLHSSPPAGFSRGAAADSEAVVSDGGASSLPLKRPLGQMET